MSITNEFLEIAEKLSSYSEETSPQAHALIEAANKFENSWSGSWLGYHSCVYYNDFETPPPGALFSKE
jgi:hypothetical protein